MRTLLRTPTEVEVSSQHHHQHHHHHHVDQKAAACVVYYMYNVLCTLIARFSGTETTP